MNAVVAVAQVNGCGVTDLPPLYESIDPDVLNEVVAAVPGVRVHFEYAGRDVTVHGDGVDVDGETNVDVNLEVTVDVDEEA